MSVEAYQKQSLRAGWTRVDLLLQIYDRAIAAIDACGLAIGNGDEVELAKHYIDAQKAILALHSGLKPDEHEVALNIARLLHFVLVSIEKKDFQSAAKVLHELRGGFAAIADEVNQLEREGKIPAMPEDDTYRV